MKLLICRFFGIAMDYEDLKRINTQIMSSHFKLCLPCFRKLQERHTEKQKNIQAKNAFQILKNIFKKNENMLSCLWICRRRGFFMECLY
jgi:hypothetical protein